MHLTIRYGAKLVVVVIPWTREERHLRHHLPVVVEIQLFVTFVCAGRIDQIARMHHQLRAVAEHTVHKLSLSFGAHPRIAEADELDSRSACRAKTERFRNDRLAVGNYAV